MSGSVLELLQTGSRRLRDSGLEDFQESSEWLLSHVLRKPRAFLYADSDQPVGPRKKQAFFKLIDRRSSRFPLQYLIGEVNFRHVTLRVRPGTFIPRPETELVVDEAIRCLTEAGILRPRILDVGTGSGNIPVGLAFELPKAAIVATDSSARSIRLAEENAKRNGVGRKIKFVQTHLWRGVNGKFDLLISNPPYLTQADLKKLMPEVRYEPKRALDGGKDGLRFYAAIIQSARRILKAKALVVFEAGIGQADFISQFLKRNGFDDVRVTRDFAGIERIVSAKRSK